MSPTKTFNPLDPEMLEDPYPVFAELRGSSPVFWHEQLNSWALTKYSDCVSALRNHARFARDRRRAGQRMPEESRSVQSLDPPAQAPLRSLFLNALHGENMLDIIKRTRSLLAKRLDFLGACGTFDVMADLAAPISVSIISELLGVEEPNLAAFAKVSDNIMRSMDGGLDPSRVEPGQKARKELTKLVESWSHSARRPGLLTYVRDHADRIGHAQGELLIRNTSRVMFQGGYSTMVAAIGNVVDILLRQPNVLEQFRDQSLLATGIDELMRFDGPVQGTSRIAMEDCQIGCVAVQAGDQVTILFAAANRDPAQFRHPNQLKLTRSPNQHLGFGWGTHACIGSVPAQMVLRALVLSLLDYPRRIVPAGPSRRRRTATMRTFAELPATFERLL